MINFDYKKYGGRRETFKFQNYVSDEIERLTQDLKRLIRLLYEANWTDESGFYYPDVKFDIPLRNFKRNKDDLTNELYILTLSSISDNTTVEISLYQDIVSHSNDIEPRRFVATIDMKFSDWMEVRKHE